MVRIGSFTLVLVLAFASPAFGDELENKIAEANLELAQAKRLARELTEQVGQLRNEEISFDPEERFIEAQVFFDLRDYELASLLLTSLVKDPQFKEDTKYFTAIKLLGISLYNIGNYRGAQKQFELLLRSGVDEELAVSYLVEIAARLGKKEKLERLAATGPSDTPGLRYQRGKAYYLVGKYSEALEVLRQVPADSPDGMRARYVSGACLVALNRINDATRVFESMVAGSSGGEKPDEVKQFAFLALGRLAYEQGDFSKAADYYQRIPRDSPMFDSALYEVTQVYIKWARQKSDPQERLTALSKAEEMLEILSEVTKDQKLSREASVLRGRISMYMEKYEQAEEAYQEVIDRFAKHATELADLAQSPEEIQAFFDAMVEKGGASNEVKLRVSEEVVDFMREQPRLRRMMDMLEEVAAQRMELESALKVYEKLKFSLSEIDPRELFPGFADAWLKSLEIEDKLLAADAALLDAESLAVRKRLGKGDVSKLEQLRRERAALEDKLVGVSEATRGAHKRNWPFAHKVRELCKDVDDQVLRLHAILEQVNAMQKLLKEVKYKGSSLLQVKDEPELVREVLEEGLKVSQLLTETEGLKVEVEKMMLVAEIGNAGETSQQDVKAALWRQHGEEAGFFIELSSSLPLGDRQAVERANAMRREIIDLLGVIHQQQELIDRKTGGLLSSFERDLAGEKSQLDALKRELKAVKAAALRLASDVGPGLCLKAKQITNVAVVEADLGLMDLAWKRKQDETDWIEAIKGNRAQLIKRLEAELEGLRGGEEKGSE